MLVALSQLEREFGRVFETECVQNNINDSKDSCHYEDADNTPQHVLNSFFSLFRIINLPEKHHESPHKEEDSC